MKFILVHDASDAEPIVINTERIVYAEKSELLTGATYIQTRDIEEYPSKGYHVTETPEQLFKMLND